MNQHDDMEKHIERLLQQLAEQGNPVIDLTDTDIDTLLESTPPVKLSANFTSRALAAMQNAQKTRNPVSKPTKELAQILITARNKNSLTVDQVASHTRISVSDIELLELGQLTVLQFMNKFTPRVILGVLRFVQASVEDFVEALSNVTAHTNFHTRNPVSARTYQHNTASENSVLIERVSEYVSELEKLSRTKL
jgi:hypothetical protein